MIDLKKTPQKRFILNLFFYVIKKFCPKNVQITIQTWGFDGGKNGSRI